MRVLDTNGSARLRRTDGAVRLKKLTVSAAAATAIVSATPIPAADTMAIGSTRSQDITVEINAQNGAGQPIRALSIANQHTSSFSGADMDLLFPDPGGSTPNVNQMNYAQLDADVLLMGNTPGVALMLTILNVPKWMSMGPQGPDDRVIWPTDINSFSHQDHIPCHPQYLGIFGEMQAAIAARYDGSGVDKTGVAGGDVNGLTPPAILVEKFQFWNEMKGLYINPADFPALPAADVDRHWYEHYIAMYDAAYAAMKLARPDAGATPFRLGVGYVALATWAAYRSGKQDMTLGVSEARYLTRDWDVYRAILGLIPGVAGVVKHDNLFLIDVKSQSNDHFGGPLWDDVTQVGISQDPFDSMPRKMRECRAELLRLLALSSVPFAAYAFEIGVSEYYTMFSYITNDDISNGYSPFQLWAGRPVSERTEKLLAAIMAWSWIGTQEAGINWILLWKFKGGWIDRFVQSIWPLCLYDSAGNPTAAVEPLQWWKDNITGRADVHFVECANPNVKVIKGNGLYMVVPKIAQAMDVIIEGTTYTTAADYSITYVDPNAAPSAVVGVESTTNNTNGSGTVYTIPSVPVTAANKLVLAVALRDNANADRVISTTTPITRDGQSFVFRGSADDADKQTIFFYSLDNPNTGTADVVVTLNNNAAGFISGGVVALTDAAAGAFLDTGEDIGTGANPSVTLTSVADGLALEACIYENVDGSFDFSFDGGAEPERIVYNHPNTRRKTAAWTLTTGASTTVSQTNSATQHTMLAATIAPT